MKADDGFADWAIREWAAWYSAGRPLGHLGYGESVLGRALRDMPGTNCTTCRARGWINGARCPQCRGSGRVRLDKPDGRANPAFIHGEGQRPDPEPPALVSLVDAVIHAEPIDVRICVLVHYLECPWDTVRHRTNRANDWLDANREPPIKERTFHDRIARFRRRLLAELRSQS